MKTSFSIAGLVRRTAAHHILSHVFVTGAAASAAAVITGALIVGDSIRGSLEDRVRERLGKITAALVAPRPFREALEEDLARHPSAGGVSLVAGVLARGSAEHAGSGAREGEVAILGVPPEFWDLRGKRDVTPDPRPGLAGRRVALNERLAAALGASPGDSILLRLRKESEVPAEHALGKRSQDLRSLRLEVDRVLPDAGLALFRLDNAHDAPRNAFVPLDTLQKALDLEGLANAVLAAPPEGSPTVTAAVLDGALARTWTLDDAGLRVRVDEPRGHASLESRELILPGWAARAGRAAADAFGLERLEVLAYLANTIRGGEREIPYSIVAGVGSWHPGGGAALPGLDGAPGELPPLLVHEWTAEDLGARPGAEVELLYNELTEAHRLVEKKVRFRIAAVEPLRGPLADPGWTPEYPGISDAESLATWDPPFPMDLKRIRPRDETYWDEHRTTPKAFTTLDEARRLWSSRFGDSTSLRVRPPAGDLRPIARAADELRARILADLPPARAGLSFRDVRDEALLAARSGTDFGSLFLALSSFIIISALVLTSMLFRLACERRAREAGILAAAGFAPRDLRKVLLGTGAASSLAGALLGLLLGVGYAGLLLAGLRTWWKDAVNAPFLSLHASAASIAIGAGSSVILSMLAVWLVAARFSRTPPRILLGGAAEDGATRLHRDRGRLRLALAVALGLSACGLLGLVFAGRIPEEAGFFGGGALFLASFLAVASHVLRKSPRAVAEGGGLLAIARMGARQAGRAPGRSLLSAVLIASAAFIITAVTSRGRSSHGTERNSGSGGISVIARSSVPLLAALDSDSGREDLGLSAETSKVLSGTRVYALRLQPGDDASCLNLTRPSRPRIAGVPERFRERGGFAWDRTLASSDDERANPWKLLENIFPTGAVPAVGDANTVKWILRSGLGEEIAIPAEDGREIKLRIVGLLSKSIFQGELIVAEEAFLGAFPSTAGQSLFLFETGPEGDARALERALEKDLADEGVDAVSTSAVLEEFEKVENTYLSTFQVLGALGLLLGTFGLGAVLLRNVNERRGELAVLRAVGWPRKAIAVLVVSETLYLLFLGLTAGVLAAGIAILPGLRGGGVRWAPLAASLAVVLAAGVLSSGIAVAAALRAPLLGALRRE